MFDAIEDIPTQALIAELHSRGKFVVKSHEAPMLYRIWNDNDPNDSFDVRADNPYDAGLAALDELGWCVGSEPFEHEEDDEVLDELAEIAQKHDMGY